MPSLLSKKPILILATLLLIVTAGAVWLHFNKKPQPLRTGFTMISKQVFIPNDSTEKRLGAIQVRFQNAAGSWRQVHTFLNPNGTVLKAMDNGGYVENTRSDEMLRRDPHFAREEYVMGYKTFVLRWPKKDQTEYSETFLSPELQNMAIKHVVVSRAGIEVIEPIRIEIGDPEIRLWSESAKK